MSEYLKCDKCGTQDETVKFFEGNGTYARLCAEHQQSWIEAHQVVNALRHSKVLEIFMNCFEDIYFDYNDLEAIEEQMHLETNSVAEQLGLSKGTFIKCQKCKKVASMETINLVKIDNEHCAFLCNECQKIDDDKEVSIDDVNEIEKILDKNELKEFKENYIGV